MEGFCDTNCLKRLFKVPTYFKNPDKLTCIHLILASRLNLFQHSSTFETGPSDLNLLTVTQLKMGFQKLKPEIIAYLDYKNFDNAKFRFDIVTANVDNFGMYKKHHFQNLIAMSL